MNRPVNAPRTSAPRGGGTDRSTAQRRAMEGALRRAGRPLSPGELLKAARVEAPSINLATVYRALRRLTEAGTLRPVQLPGEPPRYELHGLGHHHHFRCDDCERVFDVAGPCPRDLAQRVPPGFSVRDHEILLLGLCAECGGGVRPRAGRARRTIARTPRPRAS